MISHPDDTFDLVMCMRALSGLADFKDYSIEKILRITRKGGGRVLLIFSGELVQPYVRVGVHSVMVPFLKSSTFTKRLIDSHYNIILDVFGV